MYKDRALIPPDRIERSILLIRGQFAAFPYDRGFTLCSMPSALCFFVASRPGRPLLERSGPSVLCSMRFVFFCSDGHGARSRS